MIDFFAEDVSFPELDFEDVKRWVAKTIESKNCHVADISFIFCSDEYLLELNRKYLNHDYYTDILTFNYNQDNYISGDLFLSLDRIAENAKNLNILFIHEILRVCIHGVLHLLGYEDSSEMDKNAMRLEEDKYLKIFFDVKKI
jgi:probable rRNA maturation factor